MFRQRAALILTGLFALPLASQEPVAEAPPANSGPCVVRLKDGSVIRGDKLTRMTGRVLEIETSGAPAAIKIAWLNVQGIECEGSVQVILITGEKLHGTLIATDPQFIAVRGEALLTAAKVATWRVEAINPPPTEPTKIEYRGDIGLGASLADGNSQSRSMLFNANFEARGGPQRLTAEALWNYAENQNDISARNTKGGLKYDYFFEEKTYGYVGSRFEEDTFADLNLRTTLIAGFGNQFVDRGDFDYEWLNGIQWLKDTEFSGEAGIAYISEDFRLGSDCSSIAARWSAKVDVPVNDTIRLFHRHEGYPGLENLEDVYVTSQQGVAVEFWNGFQWTAQVNWDWDNTPSPGFERSQFLYMMTIGYRFGL